MLALLGLSGCVTLWRARFAKPADSVALDASAPFLKAHLESGELYVLTQWTIDAEARVIRGEGIRYDLERRPEPRAAHTLGFDEVALVETNVPHQVLKSQFVVMGVLTAVNVGLAAACLSSPKSCFGSCPTFYARTAAGETIVAEGFSQAVARSLETTDVDALAGAEPTHGVLHLTMKNEALESHAIRQLAVLAVPRPETGRVYRDGEHFFQGAWPTAPTACSSASGDCLEAVARADALEYHSPADGADLATRETVRLRFDRPPGLLGLVVRGRASLLTTFVLYQALAWMGTQADEWLMALDRAGPAAAQRLAEVGALLGDVEVWVKTARGFERAGRFSEQGPISRDEQLIRLPDGLPPGPVELELRLTKGHWKLDQLGLVALGQEVAPVAVPPSQVRRAGAVDAEALRRVRGDGPRLISNTGDVWELDFPVPRGPHEYFLEARGYYHEWIRGQWLPEQDPDKVARLFADPQGTLRSLAPAFKQVEPEIDRLFDASRIAP